MLYLGSVFVTNLVGLEVCFVFKDSIEILGNTTSHKIEMYIFFFSRKVACGVDRVCYTELVQSYVENMHFLLLIGAFFCSFYK